MKWPELLPSWHPTMPRSSLEQTFLSTEADMPCARDKHASLIDAKQTSCPHTSQIFIGISFLCENVIIMLNKSGIII